MLSVPFQGKPFNIMVIQVYAPTSNGEEAEVEWFQKNIYFCFIDYAKVFDCVDHNKLWKILREMGIPEHLT